MDSDDRPIGRVLTRREILALFGGSSAALIAACAPAGVLSGSASPAPSSAAAAQATAASSVAVALPSCVVRPALTEGPYFVDEKLNRSDIRTDPSTNIVRPGTALAITFNVARVGAAGCTALSAAQI